MSRELVYRFCCCGCATGCDPHYDGFTMEARYCPEGARLYRRAEELGASLSAMPEGATSRRARRSAKALSLRMIRAVRDLESHRAANASGKPRTLPAGELPPPGAYSQQQQTAS